MEIISGFDPTRIDEAGWGILFPDRVNPGVVEALDPLLQWRREQAAARYDHRFRQYLGSGLGVRPGESKNDWLRRQGAGPGPADPDGVPYYLLIAASPAQISFQFERQLNVQYAVGRVWFERLEDWRAYAESVVQAEREARACLPRLFFFHPSHTGDPYTQAVNGRMQELARQVQSSGRLSDWQILTLCGPEATRASLIGELENGTPALTLLAGHALVFPPGHARQYREQGGLVCADWPGPAAGAPPRARQCFNAGDVPESADLGGSVFILHASYSLGTPEMDDLVGPDVPHLTGKPFIARLPQRLLSLPGGRGALAVIGWNNRLWNSADPQQSAQENSILENCLAGLAAHMPVGHALEAYSQRYAELSTTLADYLTEADYGAAIDPLRMGGYWVANNNARDLALFGDPAVRLLTAAPVHAEPVGQEGADWAAYFPAAAPQFGLAELSASPIELETRLSPGGRAGQYGLVVRVDDPGGGAGGQSAGEIQLNLEELRGLASEPAVGGHALWNALFASESSRGLLRQALASADNQDLPVRLRLTFDPAVGELCDLPWETMLDPGSGGLLARQEQMPLLTRSLSETAWSAVEPRQRERPRALVAVAAPGGLEARGRPQAPVDRAGEIFHAQEALSGYEVAILSETAGHVSHGDLVVALRGGYDVLYLVCHAAGSARGEIGLFFERPDGQVSLLRGEQFAQLFRNMSAGLRPRLVVLIPPMTAGLAGESPTPSITALARLAPVLIQAGVSAVVAFQADLPITLRRHFLPVFFERLMGHGQVDQAVRDARVVLAGSGLAWAPVLYTRPAAGRLWTDEQSTGKAIVPAPPEPFEIALTRQGVAEYAVEMRFRDTRARGPARLDFAGLQALAYDSTGYGALLAQNLLADPGLSAFFQQRLLLAQSGTQPLQMRLAADPGASELHTLRWESLVDPSSGALLALSEDLAFTRYLFSADWRRVETRSTMYGGVRRMVLAVASPEDLASYGLIQLEFPGELLKVIEGMTGLHVSVLGQEPGEPVTLDRLARELKGGVDLLWLICHGTTVRGEHILLLADKTGRTSQVKGSDLVRSLSGYARLPALVHLSGSWSVPTGLALAEAGVQAALVMNGNISKRTYQRFAPCFLSELLVDGNPARAAAVARLAVHDQPDWWVPALFTRLREPNLW